MEKIFRPLGLAGRALAVVTVLGAAGLYAQTTAKAPTTLDLSLPAASTSAEPAFSTSAPDNEVAVNAEHFNFTGLNAMQYGGRSRSGRPRYRGGNTNPDGSEKYTFFAGAGFAAPVRDTATYNNLSWGYQVGVGRNFNKHAGVQIEFDYDHFGLKGNTLANQAALYDYYTRQYNQTPAGIANPGTLVAGELDGNMHDWSFVLDPTYSFYSGEGLGAYVIGGGGFYHKVTNFTVPVVGEAYDPYYGYYEYQANQTIDHYTSNAFGLNGGIGMTYKFSRFGRQRLYAEARYTYTFNQYSPGITSSTPPAQLNAYTGANEYPQNSLKTSFIPVKVGIRF